MNTHTPILSLAVTTALVLAACGQNAQSETALVQGPDVIKADPIVYVALGDSTGSGVGAVEGGYVVRLFKRILEHKPGSQLVNLCVSGATTADVVRGQLQSGVAKNPQLVTVGIGINDIGHGLTLEEFSENYEKILSTLKEQTHAQIVITNIPDISSAPVIPSAMRGQYHQQIVTYNQRAEEIATRHGVTIFDIHTITAREVPSHPEYFSGDGFHPSDKGYELWATEMWPTVERAISGKQ